MAVVTEQSSRASSSTCDENGVGIPAPLIFYHIHFLSEKINRLTFSIEDLLLVSNNINIAAEFCSLLLDCLDIDLLTVYLENDLTKRLLCRTTYFLCYGLFCCSLLNCCLLCCRCSFLFYCI